MLNKIFPTNINLINTLSNEAVAYWRALCWANYSLKIENVYKSYSWMIGAYLWSRRSGIFV